MSDDGTVREAPPHPQPPRAGITLGGVVAGLALAAFVVFIFQNLETRSVTLLWFDVDLPIWLLLVIVFTLGVIVGWFAKSRKVARKRREAAAGRVSS